MGKKACDNIDRSRQPHSSRSCYFIVQSHIISYILRLTLINCRLLPNHDNVVTMNRDHMLGICLPQIVALFLVRPINFLRAETWSLWIAIQSRFQETLRRKGLGEACYPTK